MAFSTGEDLKNFYEIDIIKGLVSQSDETLSNKDALSSPILTNAISVASGRIKAALIQGKQYAEDDLTNYLQNDGLAYYKQLECDLAMVTLFKRKPHYYPEIAEGIRTDVEERLELIRRGINVLGIQRNIDAGVPDPVHMPEPEVFSIQQTTMATKLAGNYYPTRNTRQ